MSDNPMLNAPDPGASRPLSGPGGQTPAGSAPALPAAQTPPLGSLPAAPVAPPVPPTPPKPTTAAPSKRRLQSNATMTGIAATLDTIEAVVIALILALTFRAFVVEAFVIPTGSMAPTLLGAHVNVICPRCGYEFTENADLDVQYFYDSKIGQYVVGNPGGSFSGEHSELTDSTAVVTHKVRYCPNCHEEITAEQLPGHPLVRSIEMNPHAPYSNVFPWTNNGDRILVLKYLYAISQPRRWDVIVFKEPMKGQDNYIKRLIGLPGETIEATDGDIFINGQIARKPDYAQSALWQLVYDNDYFPQTALADGWTCPWKGATPDWTITGPIINYGGGSAGSLAFNPAQRDMSYFYNTRGYNDDELVGKPPEDMDDLRHSPRQASLVTYSVVGDLHLALDWQPADAGQIALTLGLPENCYRATWRGATLTLQRLDPATGSYHSVPTTPLRAIPAVRPGVWQRITMNNVDHRVQVYINGQLVLQHDSPWTVPLAAADERATDQAMAEGQLRPTVDISVSGRCRIGHLKLMRDVYYTDRFTNHRDYSDSARGVYPNPITLDKDEFFAMGDNSTASYDSRLWDRNDDALKAMWRRMGLTENQILDKRGIVPRRYLLGRAFFVYWPAGYRPLNGDRRVPGLGKFDIPLIPNTGEMRFIR